MELHPFSEITTLHPFRNFRGSGFERVKKCLSESETQANDKKPKK